MCSAHDSAPLYLKSCFLSLAPSVPHVCLLTRTFFTRMSFGGFLRRVERVFAQKGGNCKQFFDVYILFLPILQGIRLFYKKKASDADEARALSHAPHHVDIYSNSWGPGDKGFEVAGPGYLTQRVLRRGAETVT